MGKADTSANLPLYLVGIYPCFILAFQGRTYSNSKKKKFFLLPLILLSFIFAQTFLQSAHVCATRSPLIVMTSYRKVNTPVRTAASQPCALHPNNWQQAVLTSKGNSTVRSFAHPRRQTAGRSLKRGEETTTLHQLVCFLLVYVFLLLDKMTSMCSLYK